MKFLNKFPSFQILNEHQSLFLYFLSLNRNTEILKIFLKRQGIPRDSKKTLFIPFCLGRAEKSIHWKWLHNIRTPICPQFKTILNEGNKEFYRNPKNTQQIPVNIHLFREQGAFQFHCYQFMPSFCWMILSFYNFIQIVDRYTHKCLLFYFPKARSAVSRLPSLFSVFCEFFTHSQNKIKKIWSRILIKEWNEKRERFRIILGELIEQILTWNLFSMPVILKCFFW